MTAPSGSIEVQAHRGARSFFPQNTVPAFRAAVELGARVIELDLCASRDDRIIVQHDPWIPLSPPGRPPRPSPPRRPLYALGWPQIASSCCGYAEPGFPRQQESRARPPLLSEVFADVDACMASQGLSGELLWNLEIKSSPGRDHRHQPPPRHYARLVLDVVHAAGMAGRVRIQSFDWRIVRTLRRLDPRIPCGLLVEKRRALRPALRHMGFVPDWVNPAGRLLDRALSRALHAKGVSIAVWTLNRPEEMLRAARLGADAIITDFPELALPLLARSGCNFPPQSLP